MNFGYWLTDPLSPIQIVSWILLLGSLVLVIHGTYLLYKLGKPDPARDDPTLIGIENTTQLVTTGIYRYIRHPIYSSLLLLAWGAFLKQPSIVTLWLVVPATAFLTLTARMEEFENIRFFGEPYRNYMLHSKMFIPFLF